MVGSSGLRTWSSTSLEILVALSQRLVDVLLPVADGAARVHTRRPLHHLGGPWLGDLGGGNGGGGPEGGREDEELELLGQCQRIWDRQRSLRRLGIMNALTMMTGLSRRGQDFVLTLVTGSGRIFAIFSEGKKRGVSRVARRRGESFKSNWSATSAWYLCFSRQTSWSPFAISTPDGVTCLPSCEQVPSPQHTHTHTLSLSHSLTHSQTFNSALHESDNTALAPAAQMGRTFGPSRPYTWEREAGTTLIVYHERRSGQANQRAWGGDCNLLDRYKLSAGLQVGNRAPFPQMSTEERSCCSQPLVGCIEPLETRVIRASPWALRPITPWQVAGRGNPDKGAGNLISSLP